VALASCLLVVLGAYVVLGGHVPTSASTPNTLNLQARKSFRDCAECPEMVVIPGGRFTMGSPKDEPGHFYSEWPQRQVTIHQFAAGKFDVTRGEWASFVKATNRTTPDGCGFSGFPEKDEARASWRKLGFPQDDQHPVVCVTWEDAQDYAQWLSQRTRHRYRLLSEAEWEYAARAGTSTPYPWGTNASHDYANYGTEKCCGDGLALGRDKWVYTSPVGSFPPNAFGLYDMNGNVLQFVQDCFSPSYTGLPTDGSAYQKDDDLTEQKLRDFVTDYCTQDVLDGHRDTAKLDKCVKGFMSDFAGRRSCSFRMLRGGDWGDPPKEIRSAFRNFGPPPWMTRSAGVGFRVARTLN